MFAPANPEHAIIVDKIAEALAALPMGDTIAYAKLNELSGREVDGRYRYLLVKATEAAEKQLGCVFECVRSVGVKRLNSSEAPEVGLAAIQAVRRRAKRGAKRLGRLSANSLSDTENKRVIAYRAMLGAIATVADGRKVSTLAVVADPARPIPPGDILGMFMKQG